MVRHIAPEGAEFLLPYTAATQDTVVSLYAHLDLSRIHEWVDVGDWVEAGDTLGLIGPYGSGPHLHWELRIDPSYGVGYGYSCSSTIVGKFTWPSEFVLLNRRVRYFHRDFPSLSFGTNDGGVRLTQDGEGNVTVYPRPSVAGANPFALAPSTLPVAGSAIAVTAGNFVFALLQDNVLRVAGFDGDGLGSWSVIGGQPPNAGTTEQMAYHGDFLYCIGSSIEAAPVRHDGSLGAWFAAGTIPITASGYSITVNGDHVFHTGGQLPGHWTFSDRVFSAAFRADGTLEPWIELAPMPEAKGSHGSVVSREHLFVVGGLANSGGAINPTVNCYSSPIQEDGTLGPWTQTASHALIGATYRGIAQFPLLSLGHALLTVGGFYMDWWNYWGRATDEVYLCTVLPDGSTTPWQLVSSIPSRTKSNAAVVHDEQIVALGGDGDVYDPEARDAVWEASVISTTSAVSTARYSNCFAIPSTAKDIRLAWDVTDAPGSYVLLRYRTADPTTSAYGSWSSWSTALEVEVPDVTNRVAYEVLMDTAPGEIAELRGVEVSYTNPEDGTTPVGNSVPVSVGAALTCRS